MVAFAGRKYAARSAPIFVSNSSFTVSSFTLVWSYKFRLCLASVNLRLRNSDDSSLGSWVQKRQTSKLALEEGWLWCLYGQVKLCLPRETNLRYQNTELQDPRACRLQHRHPAGLLRHWQTRVSSKLMVWGGQPATILPVWALLQPQGHPEWPVQQVLLGCLAWPLFILPCLILSIDLNHDMC